jgi:hypothetical protein
MSDVSKIKLFTVQIKFIKTHQTSFLPHIRVQYSRPLKAKIHVENKIYYTT